MNTRPEQHESSHLGNMTKLIVFGLAAFVIGVSLFTFLNPLISEKDLRNLRHATSLHHTPKIFPKFSLTDHNANKFSNENLNGLWNFIFFGFTHCPDVCPLTLSSIDQVINNIANLDKPIPVQGIFISVDPNRDTAERLHTYVKHFNEKMVGLTGSDNEINLLTQALGVVYTTPISKDDKNYLVDHSAHIFLVAPNGTLSALFSTPHEANTILENFKIISRYYIQKLGS